MSTPRRTPLALIERLDRDGMVVRDDPIHAWPVTLGRSLDCDIVLDDPHVAARHARLDEQGGVLVLEVGQTTINGAHVGNRHHAGGSRVELAGGDVWRLGATRLRVRRAADVLAPERPLSEHALASSALHTAHPADWMSLLGWLVLVLGWMAGQQWLDSDPGRSAASGLYTLLGASFGLAAWALLWSLGSKLFQGRLQYLAHLRIALKYTLAWMLVSFVPPALSFVTGLSVLSRISDVLGIVVMCALVWSHLCVLLPGRRRMLALGLATAFVVGTGLGGWLQHQRSGRWFSELYSAALLPPALRLAPTSAPGTLIDDARKLRAPLDEQVQEEAKDQGGAADEAEDAENGEDGEDAKKDAKD